jgi:DM4/DM12 family
VLFITRVIYDIIIPVWPLINATNTFLTFDLPFRFLAPSYSQLTSLYSSLGRMEENDIELDHNFLEEHRANEDRRTLLQGLESVFSKFGYEGEACVQRAICELVETPIMHNGLLGKAVNLLL